MFDSYIITGINKAVDLLKEKADIQTPVDYGDLIANTKKKQTRREWNAITWWLINETEYAEYVEYGVWKSYNYYKDGNRRKWWKPFHTWEGARMFTKAQFENESKARAIIEAEIDKGIQFINNQSKTR